MRVTPIDERDGHWEDHEPVFRVYLHTRAARASRGLGGVALLLAATAGCGHEARPTAEHSPVERTAGVGSLSSDERALATRLAHQQEGRITGVLVGASAFVNPGSPLNQGVGCKTVDRVLYVRLVWQTDADFTHNHPPADPPDGNRRQIFITADPTDGRLCDIGADYRHPGAGPGETLLFGTWPRS